MNCIMLLRRIGLWPKKRASITDITTAVTENALRDNEQAFKEVSSAYEEIPKTNDRMHEALQRTTTMISPFADLENLMRRGTNRTQQLRTTTTTVKRKG